MGSLVSRQKRAVAGNEAVQNRDDGHQKQEPFNPVKSPALHLTTHPLRDQKSASKAINGSMR